LSKALESENDREAVTELTKSKGYDFSSKELWAEIQKRQAKFERKQAAGELSEEELKAVASGILMPMPSMSVMISIPLCCIFSPRPKW